MRIIEYKNLSPELKAVVKRMEEVLNSQKNLQKPSESRQHVLTNYPIANSSTSNNDKTAEDEVAVFRVETATGKYIFSHIENKDLE